MKAIIEETSEAREVRYEVMRIARRLGASYEDMPKIAAWVAHRMFLRAVQPMLAERACFFKRWLSYQMKVSEASFEECRREYADYFDGLDGMIAEQARRHGLDSSQFLPQKQEAP